MSDGTPACSSFPGGSLLVVVSGPSGVGKDAALSSLRTLDRPRHFMVTATTRPMRSNEREGVDYIFLSPRQFQTMVKKGEFLEYAEVYGHWYGSPSQQVREAMGRGQDTILKVDVQGAAALRSLVPEAVYIFLVPSSLEELRRRLSLRATESPAGLELRTRTAEEEMERLTDFDYRVVNRDGCLDETVACIDAIILAERCRIPPRQISI